MSSKKYPLAQIGLRIGDLTVIDMQKRVVLARCQCGSEEFYPKSGFECGSYVSCGCRHKAKKKSIPHLCRVHKIKEAYVYAARSLGFSVLEIIARVERERKRKAIEEKNQQKEVAVQPSSIPSPTYHEVCQQPTL